MLRVHHSAAQGYTAAAESYVKGRPNYPPEIVGWLRSTVGLGEGKRVLDLGAGPGKVLPYLKATGAQVHQSMRWCVRRPFTGLRTNERWRRYAEC
jgi:hypothetical protein